MSSFWANQAGSEPVPHAVASVAHDFNVPRLLAAERCRTIKDMRLVNALCRFVELAEDGVGAAT